MVRPVTVNVPLPDWFKVAVTEPGVDVAVYETIKAYSEGTFTAGVQVFNLATDGVGYSTSGGFIDDIVDQIDEFAQQIIDGTIEVPTATS